MKPLNEKKCVPCEGGAQPMAKEEVIEMLRHIDGWMSSGTMISKVYNFGTPQEALDFVAETGKIANEENHHPNTTWSYKKVTVIFSTHAIRGLSENDFIMAAKFDKAFKK